MAIYHKSERLCKNVGVVQLAVPFHNLPAGNELNHEETIGQDSKYAGQETPTYEEDAIQLMAKTGA